MKPNCKKQKVVGTRVCVYKRQAYNCLFPGTVDEFESSLTTGGVVPPNMVQVVLDDGDEREVSIDNVRLLPPNYSHVGKLYYIMCCSYSCMIMVLDRVS